jgi:hypothetical protein
MSESYPIKFWALFLTSLLLFGLWCCDRNSAWGLLGMVIFITSIIYAVAHGAPWRKPA